MDNRSLNRPIAWLIVGVVLLGSGWVWWSVPLRQQHSVSPRRGPGEWIVYPRPLETARHSALPFWAEFHRLFMLAAAPPRATLLVRAFKQGTVRINGQLVDRLPLRESDLETPRTSEVAKHLKTGK